MFLSLSCLSNDIAFKCNASVTITKDADKTLNYYECNKPSISTPHLPSIEPPQTTFEPPTIHEVEMMQQKQTLFSKTCKINNNKNR